MPFDVHEHSVGHGLPFPRLNVVSFHSLRTTGMTDIKRLVYARVPVPGPVQADNDAWRTGFLKC